MPADDKPTPIELMRSGTRRRRLARLADAAAEREPDPVRASEHRRTAEVMRFGARLAFRDALRDLTIRGPAN